MKWHELTALLTIKHLRGSTDVEVSGIQMHSQRVQPGDVFVCVPGIPGHQEDRHPFAEAAVQAGAVALVVERDVNVDVPTIMVPDAYYAMAVMAAHLNGYPSRSMKLIGVTGTNGKTTTSYMIEALLAYAGYRTGMMGNIGTKIGSVLYDTDINTQEPPKLQANLRRMREAATDYAVMEVTSQGLHTGRVMGCEFRTAVFTNLTQDHLNYHGTMEAYLAAKGLLFSRLGNGFSSEPSERRFAVLNADDPTSEVFRSLTTAQVLTYSIEREADVRAANVELTGQGTEFDLISWVGTVRVCLRMVGLFNVSNALAAATVALAEGTPLAVIQEGLDQFVGVPGRMEVVDEGQPYLVLADFAHTPDGLDKALSTIRDFADGRVITVFGCGGDRDRTKRPMMGEIAAKYSDIVIVTSDNPRSEDPYTIMTDIEGGVVGAKVGSAYAATPYELIEDRREAIARAIRLASTGDVVLIAGKGHETYQIVKSGTIPFDDRQAAREAILEQVH